MTQPTTIEIAGAIRSELRMRAGERADVVRFEDDDIRLEHAARPGAWHVRAVAFPVGLSFAWDDAVEAVRYRYPRARKH